MSTLLATTDTHTPNADSPQATNSKPRRLLACVLCQQRKVKCDHNYPCATCVKARVPCIQAVRASRRRRRRLPEKDLLTRLDKYEELLNQNNIRYEPRQQGLFSVDDKKSPASTGKASDDSDDEELEPGTVDAKAYVTAGTNIPYTGSTKVYEAKRMFNVMRQEVRNRDLDDSSDDEVQPILFKKAWDEAFDTEEHLLFGWPQVAVAMYTLHPQPLQIFQLWQLYLDNVNPLLKVTHPPSLQGRILEAAGNVLNIKPELEALMFSIYCMAVSSLNENDCQAMFATPKKDLLAGYQLGCQQALLNSRVMRCTSQDCLTALYLYLISIRPNVTPESLSSMLGVAIRIAQRMGLYSESILAKSTVLEAEMSRRLWWSLILFDTRVGEMADFQATSLLPMWDCRVPLNVNDSDLRPDMKESPKIQGKSTDALFAVVRSELGDFVRHTMFHLGYYGPSLKPTNGDAQQGADTEGGEMDRFEKMIEEKYLKFCDFDNPLHYMTVWTTRGHIAKFRLMEHHSKYAGSALHQADTQRDSALSYALTMLECNTKLMTSSATKGFVWMIHTYFPFVAYIQIVQYLKWRPMSGQATSAWQVMNDNFHAIQDLLAGAGKFFELLAGFVLQAWEARETAFQQSGSSLETPQIVVSIRQRLGQVAPVASCPGLKSSNIAVDMMADDFQMFATTTPDIYNTNHNMGVQEDYAFSASGSGTDTNGLSLQDMQMDQVDWSTMNWDMLNNISGVAGMNGGQEPQYQQGQYR